MRHAVLALAPFILSLTLLAGAQTAQPSSQPAPPADERVEDLTGRTLESPPPPPPSTAQPSSPAPAAPTRASTPPPSAAPNAGSSASWSPAAPAESRQAPECADRATRDGFYLRMMSGSSVVSVSGRGPSGAASMSGLGSSSILAIGASVARGLVLAGTLQGTTITNTLDGGPFEGATITSGERTIDASGKVAAGFSQLGLLVDWYPSPSRGWHLGVSGGLGLAGLTNQADDSTMFGVSTSGTVFGGYDWSIGRQWSLGIALVASGNTSSKMLDKEGDETGYRLKSGSIGVAASILYF